MKRQATIKRISKETEIELTLKLDGTRNYTIDTGVGFLDHMLELLAFHGELDLNILCKGDLKVDTHHSIEDIGIVLGQALHQALGDKKGIVRYATTYLPMDESLSRTSLDLCGRFYHIFKANFKGSNSMSLKNFLHGNVSSIFLIYSKVFINRYPVSIYNF